MDRRPGAPVAASGTTTTTTGGAGTFFADGGRVTASCTGPNSVELLAAVPLSGWSLEIESEGPTEVRVDFESGESESEIKVTCITGQLVAEISD